MVYFPAGLKSRLNGPGSIFVGGAAATSFLFGAIAFGPYGIAAAIVIALILFLFEVYREAAGLSRANVDLASKLADAERAKELATEVASENSELRKLLDVLKEARAKRSFGLEELLEALVIQRELIHLVQQHRRMQSQIDAAHVTLFELAGEGRCTVSAISIDSDAFAGEEVALVEIGSNRPISFGGITSAEAGTLKADLDQGGLPEKLVEELQTQGPVRRQGFALVFAGTVDPRYVGVSNEALRDLDDRLEGLSRVLSSAMPAPSIHSLGQAEDALRDLEAESDDGPPFKKTEVEVGGSK